MLMAVGAAAALALAGCSSADSGDKDSPESGAADGELSGEISFQTWALTPTFQEYLDDVINGFEEQHPGVKVKLVDQPGDGYSEKVLTQASTSTLPDVVNLPPDFALPLAHANKLVNIAETDSTLEETFVAGGIGAYEFAGLDGVWGYPWYLNTDISYWNANMLNDCGLDADNPPATEDELFEQAKTYTENCSDTHLISRAPGLEDFTRAGVQILNDEGTEFVFNTPEAVKVLERSVDAFQAGEMPSSVLNDDYLGNAKLFTQSKVAWTTGGAPAYADFMRDSPSLKDNMVISPALNLPPLYVQGISVAAESKHPETAQAFAQWVTNAENQNAFAQIVSIFPSTIASEDDPYFSEDDGTGEGQARILAFDSLKTAEVLVPVEFSDAMSTILAQQIALAMRGDVSAQEALDEAVSQINRLYEPQH